MAKKIYDFPLFDIKKIYTELKEKKIKPPKWIIEEVEKLYPIKTRVIYANSKISGGKDGVDTYEPKEREVHYHETERFTNSLEEWVTKTEPEFRESVRDEGIEECEGMGTVRLSGFYFEIIDSEEYEGEYKEMEL